MLNTKINFYISKLILYFTDSQFAFQNLHLQFVCQEMLLFVNVVLNFHFFIRSLHQLHLRSLKKMSNTKKEVLCKLFQMTYLNAFKARAYTDFVDWIEWAELNGINFHVLYRNHIQCTEFVKYNSDTPFISKDIRSKLEKVNFVSVFCHGSTVAAVIQKEFVYILFVDPENFTPQVYFLSLKDVPS